MSLLGKLLKTTIDIATMPVAIVKDAATMGGMLTDKEESYTVNKLNKLNDDVSEIRDEVDNL